MVLVLLGLSSHRCMLATNLTRLDMKTNICLLKKAKLDVQHAPMRTLPPLVAFVSSFVLVIYSTALCCFFLPSISSLFLIFFQCLCLPDPVVFFLHLF